MLTSRLDCRGLDSEPPMNTQTPIAEIFSQGEEVVTGQIADTNAAWLARELIALGLDVTRHSAVGDRLDDLVALLREIEHRADCCLCTGGLGPTADDLTAEAVARAFGLGLVLDEIALTHIEAHFARLGAPMPVVNRKQALLPQGALRLDNHWGTAPGFALQRARCWFVFLPGVPSEMRAMFRNGVVPELRSRLRLRPRRLVTLRTVGVGESVLQERLAKIALPPAVTLGFRASSPEVQVKLLFPAGYDENALETAIQPVLQTLGDAVFCVEGLHGTGGDLPQIVGRMLQRQGSTLAVIETASGGLLASQCASEPWFLEASVFSENARLCKYFGVQPSELDDASSHATTVTDLAQRLRLRTGADYALAQLSIPTDQTMALHVALATPSVNCHQRRLLHGERKRQQAVAAAFSLDLLRRHLLGSSAR